eukprot:300725-Pyramimonas_sp.AAC.1
MWGLWIAQVISETLACKVAPIAAGPPASALRPALGGEAGRSDVSLGAVTLRVRGQPRRDR